MLLERRSRPPPDAYDDPDATGLARTGRPRGAGMRLVDKLKLGQEVEVPPNI